MPDPTISSKSLQDTLDHTRVIQAKITASMLGPSTLSHADLKDISEQLGALGYLALTAMENLEALVENLREQAQAAKKYTE